MGIDEARRLEQVAATVPFQLDVELLIFLSNNRAHLRLIGNDSLRVSAAELIAILEEPCPVADGFVIFEFAFVVSAVWEDPPSLHDFVFLPVANQAHSRIAVGVYSAAVLLAKLPPSRIGVFVGVGVGAFAMLQSILPLSVVLALIFIGEPTNAVLAIVTELAVVLVLVCVSVFTLAAPDAVHILPVILIVVRILGKTPTSVVP